MTSIKKSSLFKETSADCSGEAYGAELDEFDEAIKRADVMTKVLKQLIASWKPIQT